MGDPAETEQAAARVIEYFTTHLDIILDPDGLTVLVNGREVGQETVRTVTTTNTEPNQALAIREEQEKDPHLSALRQWLLHQTVPDDGTVMLWSPAEKAIWINMT